MSNRRITDSQFSAGTTIDGNRLDRAMQDVLDTYNKVKPGNMSKRHTQHQVVMGWSPSVGFTQPSLPFCPIYNDTPSIVTGTAIPDLGVQNPWRTKGSYNSNLDPTNDTVFDEQWLWTTAMTFDRPVILDGVALFLLNDTQYTNDLTYRNPPPPGKTNGDAVDDLFLELTVDNPFLLENRSQNNIEFHKTRWKVDAEKFSSMALPVGFTDMLPNHPTGGPVGLALNALGLNIPLPQASRIRFSMGIPEYRAGYTSSWALSGTRPWDNFVYSVVLTFLDATEEA